MRNREPAFEALRGYRRKGRKRFYACHCCGGYHNSTLPGSVDCRDDSRRFSEDEIDDVFGALAWEEIEQDEVTS